MRKLVVLSVVMSVDPLAVREKNKKGWLGSFIYLLGVDVVLVVQQSEKSMIRLTKQTVHKRKTCDVRDLKDDWLAGTLDSQMDVWLAVHWGVLLAAKMVVCSVEELVDLMVVWWVGLMVVWTDACEINVIKRRNEEKRLRHTDITNSSRKTDKRTP